jgi:beta-lactamase regulating signal transducer with metallopeptidase domain
VHQLESGKSAIACLLDHAGAPHCLEPGAFALALGLAVAAAAFPLLRGRRAPRPASERDAAQLLVRIRRIIDTQPALAALRGRVVVTEDPDVALGTIGWARPRVFIGAKFASSLSDEMLVGAFAHEAEHVRLFDPLRYFLLQLALAANPFGRLLLRGHAARWSAAHEAHCDRHAVLRGSVPLALAQAIVRAARPSSYASAALGPADIEMLKFRVDLLTAFAEYPPEVRRQREGASLAIAFALVALTLMLPHQTGTAPLDALHTSLELPITQHWR